MQETSEGRTYLIAVSGASCSGKTTLANCLRCALPNAHLVQQDDYYLPESQLPVDPATGRRNWEVPAALKMDELKENLRGFKAGRGFPAPQSRGGGGGGDLARNVHHGRTPQRLAATLADEWESCLRGRRQQQQRSDGRTPAAVATAAAADRIVVVDGFLLFHDPAIVELFDLRVFLWAGKEELAVRREARNGYATADNDFWRDPPGYFDDVVWPAFAAQHSLLLDSPPVLRWRKPGPPDGRGGDDGGPVATFFDEAAGAEYVMVRNDGRWDLEAVARLVVPEIARLVC